MTILNAGRKMFGVSFCGSVALIILLTILITAEQTQARNPYRKSFFNVYSSANGSRLDTLPSNSGHCGVCHYNFDGGGARNLYGLAVEATDRSESAILEKPSFDIRDLTP